MPLLLGTDTHAAVVRAFRATVEPRAVAGERTPAWVLALMTAAGG